MRSEPITAEMVRAIESSVVTTGRVPEELPTLELPRIFAAYVAECVRRGRDGAHAEVLRKLAELRAERDAYGKALAGDLQRRAAVLEAVVAIVSESLGALSEPMLTRVVRVDGQNEERERHPRLRGVELVGGMRTVVDARTACGYVTGQSLFVVHELVDDAHLLVVIHGGVYEPGVLEHVMAGVRISGHTALSMFGANVLDTAVELLWRRMWSALDGQHACNLRLKKTAVKLEDALNALHGGKGG